MSADWYNDGLAELKSDCADHTGLTIDQVSAVYAFLSQVGLIDYDIEKEIILERYGEDE